MCTLRVCCVTIAALARVRSWTVSVLLVCTIVFAAPRVGALSSHHANVALVMMDTHDPGEAWPQSYGECNSIKVDWRKLNLITFTYFLNRKYALAKGYDLIYYRLQGDGCAHFSCGAGCRHIQWGDRHPSFCKVSALGAALTLQYDWIVYLDSDAFLAPKSPELLSLLRNHGAQAIGRGSGSDNSAHGFFGWDWPYTLGPNMGFIALRNTATMRAFVSAWWNMDAGEYSTVHPFEQRPLQWYLMHMTRFRRRLQTLNLISMDPDIRSAVMHLDHNVGTKNRLWSMAASAAAWLCTSKKTCTREVREARKMLRKSWAGLGPGKRNKAIECVLRSMCIDHTHDTHQSQPIMFNASFSAYKHLSPFVPSVADLNGIPLRLDNCSGSTDAMSARWQTFELTLRKGETGPHAKCKGLCVLARFRLLANPKLCISLGQARAPRSPYAPLAQLAPCNAGGNPAAAMRLRNNYDPVRKVFRTVHRLKELRKGLPEHRTNCGFWSNCSNVNVVLPKPCWGELHKNREACGDSEPALSVDIKKFWNKTRWPGYQSYAVGPGGPSPAAMLTGSATYRLCLATWRAQYQAGTALVFHRCRAKGAPNSDESDAQIAFELMPLNGQKLCLANAENCDKDAFVLRELIHESTRPSKIHVRIVPSEATNMCISVPKLLGHSAADLGITTPGL